MQNRLNPRLAGFMSRCILALAASAVGSSYADFYRFRSDFHHGVEKARQSLQKEYGVRIVPRNRRLRRHPPRWMPDNSEMQQFLDEFEFEARRQKLNRGENKRCFPDGEVSVWVHSENWDIFDSNVCIFCSDISIKSFSIRIGHKSAPKLVSFLIESFPVEGAEEAIALDLRNYAVLQAVKDKVKYIVEESGVHTLRYDVYAGLMPGSVFSGGGQQYTLFARGRGTGVSRPVYFVQEQVLQGLINLERAVQNGEELPGTVNLTDEWGFLQDYGDRSWDNIWNRDDEKETERLIREYMDRWDPDFFGRACNRRRIILPLQPN